MVQTVEQLKNFFKQYARPGQAAFWDWLDSYRHIDDKIEVTDLDPELLKIITNVAEWAIFPEELKSVYDAQLDILRRAKEYAEAQDQLRKVELEAYADGVVTEEEQKRIEEARRNVEELKKYSKNYTDTAISSIPATWELIPISDKQVHAFNYDVTGTLNTLVYSVKFMRAGKDVTAIMQQSGLNLYNFERQNTYGFDDNNVSDASWNAAHVGAKTVTLTDKDIYAVGTLEVVYDETILENEYKRLTNGN